VRRVGLVALGVAIALVAAEVGARALADRLPMAYEWHTEEAQLKVERMDELARDGGVDVVLLGTSIVNGIDPAGLTGATGQPISAYNASLTAGVPPLTEAWFREVVQPRLRPKLVIIGVSSFDLTDEPPSRRAFFDAYLASPARRRATGRAGELERLDHWIGRRSELWGHRAALRHPDVVLDAIGGTAEVLPAYAAGLQPNGHTNALDGFDFASGHGSGGGVPVSTWKLGHDDPAVLARLVREAEATGARVVLVDMPITNTYVDKHPNGQADYATYRDALEAFAADLAVPVVRLSDIRDDALFADEVHLNGPGSAYVTGLLVASLRADGLLEGVQNEK
jgi:hypothetical protein